MAKKTQAQIQFEADTSGFTQGIREADKSLATMRNELKLNSSELKENGDSVDLLSQRQNILQREHDESAKKVEALESKLNTARSQFGDNSQEVYKLTNQLLRAKTEFQGIQNEITQTDKRMDALEQGTEDLGDSLDDSREGFTIMKGAMADLVSNGIQSMVNGISNLVGSLFELSDATEEYRQMQAKLAGSSETYGYSIEFAQQQYEKFYSYVGDDQMATNAITNLMGIATSTDNLSSIAEGAIGVWATYGDSIPIESLTEAINETVNVGKVTGTFADTINWAGLTNQQFSYILGEGTKAQQAFNKSIADGETQEDAFSEALASTNDTSERARIVAEYLNSVYGQSKTVYDELSGSMIDANKAELDLKDSQAELGEVMEPVNSAFTNFKADALEALVPVVKGVIDGLSDMKKWLDENKPVADALKVTVIVLGTAFGVLGIALGIQSLIRGITTAFAALNAIMAANPILLIVAAIAGLVAGFVYLWNNCEEFRNFWIGLWDGIKQVFSAVVDWIGMAIENIIAFFQGLWDGIVAIWNGIVAAIKFAFNLIVSVVSTYIQIITLPWRFIWENCKDIIMNVFNAIVGFIQTVLGTIWSVISSIFTSIYNFIASILSSIWSVISSIFSAIANVCLSVFNSILSVATSVWSVISGTISSIVNGIWTTISNIFNSIKNTVTNVFNSIKNVATNVWNGVKNAIETPINAAKNIVKGAIDAIKGFFNFKFKWPKLTLPHFGIKPKGWKVSDLLKGKIPTLSIDWYANGAIFNKPTLFNTASGVKGVGEAGAEAILPISRLEEWINTALQHNNAQILSIYNSNFEKLLEVAEMILAKDSNMYIDGRKVSEALSSSNDTVSGELINLKGRGLVL